MNLRDRFAQSLRSKAGKSLQDIVDEANRLYLAHGLAMIMPINTGFVPAGKVDRNGQMLYRPAKKVWNDITGVVAELGAYPGSVPILGELKNRILTTRKRKTLVLENELRKKNKDGTYDWHQRDALIRFEEFGGWSFIVLWTNFGGVGDPVISVHRPGQLKDRLDQAAVVRAQVFWRKGVLDYLDLLRD